MTLLHQAAQKAVEALKPCPFCGSPDIGWWGDVPYCGRCDAMGPTEGQDDTRENMAQAWNRRAESALQQQPEPVAHAPQRMTESEIHAHSWWCPHCRKDVPPEMVTKDGEHYLESGGCGRAVRAESALQHQEEPREPAELPAVLFDGYAVYHALSPRARLRTSPENVSDVLDAVVHLTRAASPSTTRQQEVGSGPEGFRLLPVEATDAMMYADWDVTMSDAHSNGGVSAAAWRAMVEAAPQVTYGDGHSGVGWYMHDTDYPEEGAVFLGAAAPSTPENADGVAMLEPTDDMAMAFHRATTDGAIDSEDVETIKAGLRAVFTSYGVALPASSVSTPYQFWLIERGPNQGWPQHSWWNDSPDGWACGWKDNVHEATHYPTKEHAERVARTSRGLRLADVAVTSHSLMSAVGVEGRTK